MDYIGSIPVMDSDIKHYGRLGMKWYQHIFTTEDENGKLIPRDSKEVNDDIKTINSTIKSGGEAIRSSGRVADSFVRRSKPTKKVKKKLDSMSDDELRKVVNRMNLERQYRELTGDTVRSGAAAAKSTLETVGDIVGVVGGVVSLALLLGKLKSGNFS